MTIVDVKDYLQNHVVAPRWGTGALHSTEEKQIIVFGGRAYENPKGINQASSYKGKGIRILVQWNKQTGESEEKAQEVYDFLFSFVGHAIKPKGCKKPSPPHQ